VIRIFRKPSEITSRLSSRPDVHETEHKAEPCNFQQDWEGNPVDPVIHQIADQDTNDEPDEDGRNDGTRGDV
jgi:hypothetical protein